MKKIFTILVVVMTFSMQNLSAQTARALLSHNGTTTLYEASALSTALSTAVDGDTLYLSEGAFTGDQTISKKVVIIGAGENSIINGNVTLNINGTTNFSTELMEGVKVTGTFTVSSATNGLRVRSCWINKVTHSATTNNVTYEKCYVSGEFGANATYVNSGTVINSKLYNATGSCANITFANCNLYIYNNDSQFCGSLLNSILCGSYYYLPLNSAVIMTNTLYSSNLDVSSCVKKDCYRYTSSLNLDSYLDTYLGNDGTPVGCFGGASPFTLVPLTPTVTSSSVTVDSKTQTLNVNITVKAN